ncbi:MAG TPA: hypothetical protein VF909_21235 [Roseiflexaceae bacterium]
MRSYQGYRLRARAEKQRRPLGVAILATLGVLASLLVVTLALSSLWSLTRLGVRPSVQLAVLGAALLLGLAVLWINWAFWELIRWAWWANALLSLLGIAAFAALLGYAPALVDLLGRIRPDIAARQIANGLLVGIIVGITYHLVALAYMIGVRKTFGVGVPDERPLWEKVRRH